MHPLLLVDRPNHFPFLEVTRPDTGEIGWWRGTRDDDALLAQFVDRLWGGADAWEVTGWSMVSASGPGRIRRSTWRVECRSASHGAITYMVEVHPAPTAASAIRGAMVGLGLEPGAEPATFEHLLWNAFLTVADDVAVELPAGSHATLEDDHDVWGPWAPDCRGWVHDESDVSPFVIALRWYLRADGDDTAAHLGLLADLEASFADLADRAPIVVHHNIPSVDGEDHRLAALSEGLSRLGREGWTVVDDSEESPELRDEEPSIRVRLEAWLWLVPHTDVEATDDEDAISATTSDDEDENGEDERDHESDDESCIEFEVVVPFDRETLTAIEARMIAGASPDAAVLDVTGSTALPHFG